MVVVTVGKFVDEVLTYTEMATKGEELEIVLPNKKVLQVKLKKEDKTFLTNAEKRRYEMCHK